MGWKTAAELVRLKGTKRHSKGLDRGLEGQGQGSTGHWACQEKPLEGQGGPVGPAK